MRTQTLLIAAAAALAAAVTSSQAQTVYSANVVGYVNITVPANSFSLIANQLDTGTNTINNVLINGNLVSYGANGAGESTLLIFTGAGFAQYSYFDAADASPEPAGWYDGNGNYATNLLNPGQAIFFQNPAISNVTVTLTGQVDQGTNIVGSVAPGFGFYSEPTALSGTALDSTNVNFPAQDPYPGAGFADTYQAWTGTGYGPQLTYFNAADASPEPAGWYDGNGDYEDTVPAAWPNVGAGFLVEHFGGTSNWVQTFEVQ
jgi:hypothetical protein